MTESNWVLDGTKENATQQAKLIWENDRFFTITYQGKNLHGELLEENLENRSLKLKVNHREFSVRKAGALDELIEAMGLNQVKVRKLKQLESPMPGRIVSIAVNIGDLVEPGTELLTLEAMKMENALKSEGTGTVTAIAIQANDIVDKGEVLISFS